MSEALLAWLLIVSVTGTVLAAVSGMFTGTWAHRLSTTVLAVSAGAGLVVGVVLAFSFSTVSAVSLPGALLSTETLAPNWPWFYGMLIGLDRFSAIFYALLSCVTLLTATYTFGYLERCPQTYRPRRVNALMGVLVLGMQGVLLATNIAGFMAGWEVFSMAAFFLVVADGSEAARKAGFLYLIMTHLGAGAIMTGLFLLSGGALLSDFSVLATVTPQLPAVTIALALGLLLFGFGSKAGLVPVHVWLPEVQTHAPVPAATLLSAVMVKIAVYGCLRVLLFIVPSVPLWFMITVIALGCLSAVVGVLYAVLERDIRRLLAYSSIQHTGLLFAMLGVGMAAGQEGSVELTQAAIYATLLFLLAHALFSTGLSLAAGIIVNVSRSPRLEQMGGLAQRMPQFSLMICALILAAAALPPLGSFVAEWTFLQSLLGTMVLATPMLKVALVSVLAVFGFVAGVSVFAMIKLYALVFLGQPRSDAAAQATEPPPGLLTPILLLASLSLLLGVFSPVILQRLGATDLTPLGSRLVMVGGGRLAPLAIFVVMAVVLTTLVALRQVLTDTKRERESQAWNGGQPVTARMEYTATGFSAPLRFFFRFFMRTKKKITATPLAAANPWMTTQTMQLTVNQVWYDRVYAPFGKLVTSTAKQLDMLQHGSLQLYLAAMFTALFVTMLIAL